VTGHAGSACLRAGPAQPRLSVAEHTGGWAARRGDNDRIRGGGVVGG
jgi:hypothetical protein